MNISDRNRIFRKYDQIINKDITNIHHTSLEEESSEIQKNISSLSDDSFSKCVDLYKYIDSPGFNAQVSEDTILAFPKCIYENSNVLKSRSLKELVPMLTCHSVAEKSFNTLEISCFAFHQYVEKHIRRKQQAAPLTVEMIEHFYSQLLKSTYDLNYSFEYKGIKYTKILMPGFSVFNSAFKIELSGDIYDDNIIYTNLIQEKIAQIEFLKKYYQKVKTYNENICKLYKIMTLRYNAYKKTYYLKQKLDNILLCFQVVFLTCKDGLMKILAFMINTMFLVLNFLHFLFEILLSFFFYIMKPKSHSKLNIHVI
ncbi:hypothetical protein AB837_00174 [bacterium AB1]|nr:hypothetical protein AB837_00174 [bacterium AB1]